MIDIDTRGRHEARLLREEAARMADTEKALRSVLDGEVVVPLETRDPAEPYRDESNAVVSLTSSDAESTSGRRWPILIAAAAVVLVVSALVLVTRDDASQLPVPAASPADPAAEHGLIAFSGASGVSRAESDTEIYVVAPDGTGLRALTATPGVSEMAPAWSPDGTRLTFLRNARTGGGELVVIDPSTGDETFSADIPMDPRSDVQPPEWSPDGRLIVLGFNNSRTGALAVDLETGTWTETHIRAHERSPDGRWFVLRQDETLLLVPADLLGTTDLDDVSNLPGVRPLLVQPEGVTRVTWMPDSSAVAFSLLDRSIVVVTIADGQRRTLIEDGGTSLSWSPDGSHIAYLRCLEQPDPAMLPPGSVPADMAGVDPRQPDASVWVAAADGTSARSVATSLVPPIWSTDGSLLIAVGEDGLFTVRPDGTSMTRLTQVITPKKEGPYSGHTACADGHYFFVPVWQPMPPSAETVAEAVSTDRVETTEAAVTTEPSATTDE
jgi:dipeptidyl aminopeptidase/acylaminoacyl peptidase